MEYLEILSKILNRPLMKVEDNYLDVYFEIIKKYDQQKIINDNYIWDKAFNEIEKKYSINKYQDIYDKSVETSFSQIISAILSVKKIEQKTTLIPLVIYIDNNHIFYNLLINKGFFEDLLKQLIKILLGIKINVNIDNTSDLHWEKESFNRYKTAINNKNISNIYNFIFAYERGGYAFTPNSFYSFLIYVLHKLSFKELLKFLDKQKDILTILHLVYELSIENKLKLAKYSSSILFKFEILRQVVYFKNSSYICSVLYKNEKNIIKNIIKEFSKNDIWQQFLDFYLEYPSRSPLLFKSLGLSINELEDSKINSIIDNIRINRYYSQDCKDALNSFFNNIEGSKQEYILNKIFQRWLNFVNDYDDYMNTILITGVIDGAKEYIVRFMNKTEIEDLINNCIENIKEINNKWITDETMQTNYFYIQMSKLFILYFAENKNELNINYQFLQYVLKNDLRLKNEHSMSGEKTTLQLFSEYHQLENKV